MMMNGGRWSARSQVPSEFYLLFIIFGLKLSLMSESNVVISRDMRQVVGWTAREGKFALKNLKLVDRFAEIDFNAIFLSHMIMCVVFNFPFLKAFLCTPYWHACNLAGSVRNT